MIKMCSAKQYERNALRKLYLEDGLTLSMYRELKEEFK